MGAREREQLLNERVLDARALIELAIPDKLVTKDPDGEIGGKRFTKAFERFLSSPPLIMQVLRERRFSRKHWELHWRRGRDDRDRQWQVPWVACGCVERLRCARLAIRFAVRAARTADRVVRRPC